MDELPLSGMQPGQVAHVVSVAREHPLRRRLLELGFVRGARVCVVRRAPMGDPVELRLGSSDLALRECDLHGIQVRQ